jgi:hypothetical protein
MLDKVTCYLSRQYVRRRLAGIVAPGYPILLDCPLKRSHRYGFGKPPHQQLFAMLEAGRNDYAKRLAAFCPLKGLLSQIPAESHSGSDRSGDPRDISAVWMQPHSTACCSNFGPKGSCRSVQGTLPNSTSPSLLQSEPAKLALCEIKDEQ